MRDQSNQQIIKQNLLNYSSFSTFRNAMFGFAALWIVIYHGAMEKSISFRPKIIYDFMYMGNIGVDVFILLSGIGLYFSFTKKPKLHRFYYKRLIRVYVPYLILTLPYMLFLFFRHEIGKRLLLKGILTVNFWTGEIRQIDFWYVPAILVLYLCYPMIFHFIFRNKRYSSKSSQEKSELLRVMLLAAISFAAALWIYYRCNDLYVIIRRVPSRLTVFIFGCYCGKLVKEKRRFSIWFLIAAVPIIIGAFPLYSKGLLKGVWYRYYGSLTGVALVYVLSQVFTLLSCVKLDRFFAFFGGFSLEIYLLTVVAKKLIAGTSWFAQHPMRCYALTMSVAVIAAWLFSLIEKPLFRLLLREKRSE